ncbi:MAG: carboxypeptidase-like regulatory domain-containing protein [Terriglobia bacterium]
MRIAGGILLLGCAGLAYSCSMVQVSCNFLDDKSPVVFVGTVISPQDPESEVLLHRSPITFRVTERFRGNIGQQVSVYEAGTSCDFAFKREQSYVVFAYFQNGRLMTSELTSTRSTKTAGALIAQLRAMEEGRRPASLFGYLGEGERALGGIRIEAILHGRAFTSQTRADGSFAFAYLPPGDYRLKAQLPKGFTLSRNSARVKRGESCDLQYLWAIPNGN